MKKMLFAVSALAALSLLAPTTGFAQGAHNQLGIYVDEEMSGVNVNGGVFDSIIVHLIVTNPYNEALDRPIESISGLEFRVILPEGVALDSATNWNTTDALDLGSAAEGHIVGLVPPIPSVSGVAHIATKTIILFSADPFVVHLGPANGLQSIPGAMAILDFDGEGIQQLYPASGSFEAPVFGFNPVDGEEVVATEQTTFDKLKALYR